MDRVLFERAYSKFWDQMEKLEPPRFPLHPYDLCDRVQEGNWWMFNGLMVSGELRETINQLNAWRTRLFNLQIWSKVLDEYEEDEAWSIKLHFVESIAFFCLFQPTSTRDRMGRVATNAVHQANLVAQSGYEDSLDQDKKDNRFLKRSKVERQLERIVAPWRSGKEFVAALQRMDSEEYRRITFDYRNQASHFIEPRLELGEVQFVTRRVVPKTELAANLDGTSLVEVPHKLEVSYEFGGVRALTLKEIIEANDRQYQVATEVLQRYSELLGEIIETNRIGTSL